MNSIIVDDDELSRTTLKHLVMQTGFLNLTAVCSGATEALSALHQEKTDLILLDIEMPGMSGLDLLKNLSDPPLVIFTTSKKEYAVEAFEHNVVDYLVKPISPERFIKAVSKAREIYYSSVSLEYIFIKSNSLLVKVNIREILWIEAMGDYVTVHTREKKYVVHSTLKAIENKLPTGEFVRVHRSYIVPLANIKSIEDQLISIGEKLIPIGAVYRENLIKRLNLL